MTALHPLLPRAPDTFLGRDDQLARMDAYFGRHRLFTVKGIAGIGKTSLVLAFIHRQDSARAFIYVRCLPGWRMEDLLHGIQPWLQSASRLSELLASGGPWNRDRMLGFVSILNEDGSCLVVDDLHLLEGDGVAALIEVMHTYLTSRVIFISREELPVAAIHRVDIFEEKLDGLGTEAAAGVLRSLLELHRFSPLPATDALRGAARHLGGHPLLLKLTASLLLTSRADLPSLVSGRSAAELRQFLVSHAIGQTDAPEREVLDALSLSRLPLSTEELSRLVPGGDVKAVCASLERRFLVERESSGRLSLHQLLGEYVAAEIEETRRKAVHGRLVEIFHAAGKLQAAFHHCVEAGDHARAAALLTGASSRLCAGGHYESLVDDADRLEAAGVVLEAPLLVMKANALSVLGRWRQSLQTLDAAESRTDDVTVRADARISRAGAYLNVGNLREAMVHYQEAAALLDAAREPVRVLKCVNYMAFICAFRGEVRRARQLVDDALSLCSSDSSGVGRAHALRMKGTLHRAAREFDLALDAGEAALRVAREVGSARLACWARDICGHAHLGQGRPDEAKRCFEENLSTARPLGDTQVVAFAYLGLAAVAREHGDLEEAGEACLAASRNYATQGNLLGDAIARHVLAGILAEQGRIEDALGLLEKSLATARQFDHFRLEIEILLALAELWLARSEVETADEHLRQVEEALPRVDLVELKAETLLLEAAVATRRQLGAEARALAEECRACGVPSTALRAHILLSLEGRHSREPSMPPTPAEARRAERFGILLRESRARRFRVRTTSGVRAADEKEVDLLRERHGDFDFFLDLPGRRLRVEGVGEVKVFRKRILSALLLTLVSNAGRGLTSEEIFREVWGWAWEGDSSAVEVRKNISRLRDLVEPDRGHPRFIRHVEGFMKTRGGYVFDSGTTFCLIEEQAPP